jgi:hypothetical protein
VRYRIDTDDESNSVIIQDDLGRAKLAIAVRFGQKASQVADQLRLFLENFASPPSSPAERLTPSSGPAAHPPGQNTLSSPPTSGFTPSTAALPSVEAVLEERGRHYGPNPFNQETVAAAWQAIIESHYQTHLPAPLPARLVPLMLIAMKVVRDATPFGYNADNLVDVHGYAEIAKRCDPRAQGLFPEDTQPRPEVVDRLTK